MNDLHAAPLVLSESERSRIIEQVIEELRPRMLADGGDIELVAIEGHCVKVRLGGMCASCGAANATLGYMRRTLMHALGGGPVLVQPVTGTVESPATSDAHDR
jgi:NifU-like protein